MEYELKEIERQDGKKAAEAMDGDYICTGVLD